jgi:polysaccharide export outer membrane protein
MMYRLSDYVIEPPDLLQIDAVSIIPRPPYKINAGDVLIVRVPGAPDIDPVGGVYPVELDGTISLGAAYGSIPVVGLTVPEVREKVEQVLAKVLKEPKAFVGLAQTQAMQQIRGQHLVTPDGCVRLGLYGQVPVSGLTVPQAKQAIEAHLSQYLQTPQVSVDVVAYNSKLIYVIFDGGGNGQQIVRLPVTGNDTVLDVLAQAGGLTAVSSEHRIWVARPAPPDCPSDQVMPVDWKGITRKGRTATNYQLMPGDRVYVQAQGIIAVDTALAKILAPVERLLGVTLLGNATGRAVAGRTGNGNNNGGTVTNRGF